MKTLIYLLTVAAASAQLTNGNFETGDFTGWTVFNTALGTSAITPRITLFGSSQAAEFQVGTTGDVGDGRDDQGFGMSQFVTLSEEEINISVNIAAEVCSANADAGTFDLILDGRLVDTYSFGQVYGGTVSSTLDYSGSVSAGTHEIEIEALRSYAADDCTPLQYISSVSLSQVPEPSALAFAGLAGLYLLCGCAVYKKLSWCLH
jgi:hypothetical protein